MTEINKSQKPAPAQGQIAVGAGSPTIYDRNQQSQKPAPPKDKSPFQIKVDVGYWCGGGGFI